MNDGPVTLWLDAAAARPSRATRGPSASMTRPMYLDVVLRQLLRDELLADRRRRHRRGRGRRPRVLARRSCTGCWRRPAGGRSPSSRRTATSTTSARPPTFCGDGLPVHIHEADALALTDPRAWDPGPRRPPCPSRTSGRSSTATCSTYRGVPHRGAPHAGAHARAASATARTGGCSPATSCSRGRSDAHDFPNSDAGGHGAEPPALPRAPGRARGLAGTRPDDHGRARARAQPVPRGPLMELQRRRAGPTTCCRRAPRRMLALYERGARRRRAGSGYRYVETPAFEHTELFARTSGETSDVVTKEMYTFEDKGGRSLTLRPEGTAPVVRAYLAHAHDLPVAVQGVLRERGVPPRPSAGGTPARVPAASASRSSGPRRPRPTSR